MAKYLPVGVSQKPYVAKVLPLGLKAVADLRTLLLNLYLQFSLNCIIVMVANVIAALLTTMLVEVSDPVSRNVIE